MDFNVYFFRGDRRMRLKIGSFSGAENTVI